MNCPSCHAALSTGDRFCPSCGAPVGSHRSLTDLCRDFFATVTELRRRIEEAPAESAPPIEDIQKPLTAFLTSIEAGGDNPPAADSTTLELTRYALTAFADDLFTRHCQVDASSRF